MAQNNFKRRIKMKSFDEEFKKVWATLDRIAEYRVLDEKHRLEEAKQRAEAEAKRAKEEAKRQAKLDAQIKETSDSIKNLRDEVGGIGHSNGKITEAYFYASLDETMKFGGIEFDEISSNWGTSKKMPNGTKIKGEYDVVMYNGNTIAIIEVKSVGRKKVIDRLLNEKVKNFRILFPYYANHKIILGLAALVFEPEVENDALEKGIGILKPKGQKIKIIDKHLKEY